MTPAGNSRHQGLRLRFGAAVTASQGHVQDGELSHLGSVGVGLFRFGRKTHDTPMLKR